MSLLVLSMTGPVASVLSAATHPARSSTHWPPPARRRTGTRGTFHKPPQRAAPPTAELPASPGSRVSMNRYAEAGGIYPGFLPAEGRCRACQRRSRWGTVPGTLDTARSLMTGPLRAAALSRGDCACSRPGR
jgi:hypothetical protein